MSDGPEQPRWRPRDPAGTQPKVDPRAFAAPHPHGEQLSLTSGAERRPQLALPAGVQSFQSQPAGAEPAALQSSSTQPAQPELGALEVPLAAAGAGRGASAAPSSPNAARFRILFGILGALGAAAAGIAVALAGHAGQSQEHVVPWSSWQPSSSGGDVAAQIAKHVGPEYRLPGGRQLLKVTGGPQAINGQPVVLALRPSGSNPTPLPNNGVFYQLCGEGPSCSIASGKASVERGLLVRREALELALYTFHYLSGASQVVVTFPPPPPSKHQSSSQASDTTAGIPLITTGSSSGSGSQAHTDASIHAPSHVLLFRPEEVTSEVERPLDQTLSPVTPSVNTMNASPDAHIVERLTANSLYDSVLIQEQPSSLIMLLTPPSLGG